MWESFIIVQIIAVVLAYSSDLLLNAFSKIGLDFTGPFNIEIEQAK